MAESLQATFGVAFGHFPTVQVGPPHELVGSFLATAPLTSENNWLFTKLLPALEELRNGRRQSVSASSELVGLAASRTEVELADLDIVSQPCTVPLGTFIDLLLRWRQHVETVRGSVR